MSVGIFGYFSLCHDLLGAMNFFSSSPLAAAINHVLAQEPWALNKLMASAGKVACFDIGGLSLRLKVRTDGLLHATDNTDISNVTIRMKLADLPLIAQHRDRAFSYVKIEGDADFANTISQLSQSLRWEIENDLSKWVGDIAATRIVKGGKDVHAMLAATGNKVAENTAEYLLDENPMLVRLNEVSDFASQIIKLRDDVERLGKRMEKLEGNR